MRGRYLRPRLACDLCEESFEDVSSFSLHNRLVHGVVSLKPRQVVREIEAVTRKLHAAADFAIARLGAAEPWRPAAHGRYGERE